MPPRARNPPTIISDPRHPDGTPIELGGGADLSAITASLAALTAFAAGRWEIYTNGDPVATEFLFFGGDPVWYWNPGPI